MLKRAVYETIDRFMRRPRVDRVVTKYKQYLWLVPPVLWFRRQLPRFGPWPEFEREIPEPLRSTPGIRRVPSEEERAAEVAPLRDWLKNHPDTYHTIHTLGWAYHLPMTPYRLRAARRAEHAPKEPPPGAAPRRLSPEELTAGLKALAAEVGISACGVAEYDEKYTFEEHRAKQIGHRIVICALENDWESTQTAPSVRAEKAKLACSSELVARMVKLQEFLVEAGYRARQNRNEIVLLHYAVAAGLGQLGLNGQVLTPQAGSRCRMNAICTDAPLLLDAPRDFGITKICDACQICVRRCPSGAIPVKRDLHRGIEKAKINSARCAPVVAKAHHCAACMKVCPVQRYGLDRVLDEFEASGRILGKGTAELESYEFEGVVYGPGERPVLRQEWFEEVPYDKTAGTQPVPPLPAARSQLHTAVSGEEVAASP